VKRKKGDRRRENEEIREKETLEDRKNDGEKINK
jgi:hypothetical protein